MAFQFWHQRGEHDRTGFVCLRMGYHGDTIGSVSVGGIELFHAQYRPLLFEGLAGRARRPRRPRAVLRAHAGRVAAVIVEPLVQGAAGILVHPEGYLRAARELATPMTSCSSATRSPRASGAPGRCSPASRRA